MQANEVVKLLLSKGHRLKSRPHEVNVIGFRRKAAKSNRFDDSVGVLRQNKLREWTFCEWKATTVPGTPFLLIPLVRKGTAILAAGQYRQAYELGVHKKKPALVQVLPVQVYRDSNGDIEVDKVNIERGLFGINIHRAGIFSKVVGAWSAGCQVFQRNADFEEFLSLVRKSAELYGNKFDYTLVEI